MIRATWTLAPDGDGDRATEVSCIVELTMKGPMRLLEPLMAGTVRRQIESSRGPKLRQALEQA